MHNLDPYDLAGITLEDLLDRPAWMADALCREPAYRDAAWFPETGQTLDAKAAMEICTRCLCRAECLEYAMVHHIDSGIWGSLSPNARKRLRRQAA